MKQVLYLMILSPVILSNSAMAQEVSLFKKGDIATNTDDYTGAIWLNVLSSADSAFIST